MKVAFCAAEVAPFSQAGGLGDVAGSLPAAISRFKSDNPVEIIILTPLYGLIDRQKYGLVQTELSFNIQLAGKGYPIGIWQSQLPNSSVPVYFMENQELFGDREQVYPYGRPEWELEGFLVFNQAVFELLRRLNFRPDILHVHDWHTGSIAATLSDIRPFDQYFSRTYSVLTIHNLSYQGIFGETNCLREGILKSNAVTTVSPTYAQEILTPRFGAGLDEVLRGCERKVSGILNGIDTAHYNPATDSSIPRHYDVNTVFEGKKACKAALQKTMNLPIDPSIPLVGFVGRLVDQKGLDILLPAMRKLDEQGIAFQWAFLGSGDPLLEAAVSEWVARSESTGLKIGFDSELAHQIYAGSDIFAMPSAFEPCGLGQMISMRYGSVPAVHAVGGLADTIFDVRKHHPLGNGFRFEEYTAEALVELFIAAKKLFENKEEWQALVQRCMRENHSWDNRAAAYIEFYEQTMKPEPAGSVALG